MTGRELIEALGHLTEEELELTVTGWDLKFGNYPLHLPGIVTASGRLGTDLGRVISL